MDIPCLPESVNGLVKETFAEGNDESGVVKYGERFQEERMKGNGT